MARPDDPRVLSMVKAWLEYARAKNIATPEHDGTPPEDSDVLDFLTGYLPPLLGGTKLSRRGIMGIRAMLNSAPAAHNTEQTKYLSRIKSIINNKLTNVQKKQLRRDLERG